MFAKPTVWICAALLPLSFSGIGAAQDTTFWDDLEDDAHGEGDPTAQIGFWGDFGGSENGTVIDTAIAGIPATPGGGTKVLQVTKVRRWQHVGPNGDGARRGGNVYARQVEGGTGVQNQNDLTLHFGLGLHRDPVDLEVFWPNGATQIILDIAVDQRVTVEGPL